MPLSRQVETGRARDGIARRGVSRPSELMSIPASYFMASSSVGLASDRSRRVYALEAVVRAVGRRAAAIGDFGAHGYAASPLAGSGERGLRETGAGPKMSGRSS